MNIQQLAAEIASDYSSEELKDYRPDSVAEKEYKVRELEDAVKYGCEKMLNHLAGSEGDAIKMVNAIYSEASLKEENLNIYDVIAWVARDIAATHCAKVLQENEKIKDTLEAIKILVDKEVSEGADKHANDFLQEVYEVFYPFKEPTYGNEVL